MNTNEHIEEVLKSVIDPELGIDIVTLGLIRAIHITEDGGVHVIMTLTTPLCPYADSIIENVENELTIAGFIQPTIELSFDPPWEAPASLRAQLGV